MKKDKKIKKVKEKMPALIKFIFVKEFWISIVFLVASIALGAALGLTYEKIGNEWALWVLQIVFVVVMFGFVIFNAIAIIKATGRRGQAALDKKELQPAIA